MVRRDLTMKRARGLETDGVIVTSDWLLQRPLSLLLRTTVGYGVRISLKRVRLQPGGFVLSRDSSQIGHVVGIGRCQDNQNPLAAHGGECQYRGLDPSSYWSTVQYTYAPVRAASGLKPASALCPTYRNMKQSYYPRTSRQA